MEGNLSHLDIPRSNPTAEKTLLNQLFVNPSAILDISQQLNPDDIYNPAYKSIYKCMVALAIQGKTIDAISLTERLISDKVCSTRESAMEHVAEVTCSTIYSRSIENCIETIRLHSFRRRGLDAAAKIVGICADQSIANPEVIIDEIEAEALAVAKDMGVEGGGATLAEQWPATREWYSQSGVVPRPVVPTGFRNLDELLMGGFRPGNMVVLGARPAVGKTSLACNIIYNAIKQNKKVYLAELEMTRDEINYKLVALQTGVTPVKGMRGERYTPQELSRVDGAGSLFNSSNDVLIETSEKKPMTMTHIHSSARRAMRDVAPGEGLVVIDHIGLIKPIIPIGSQSNRSVAIGASSREIKAMAKELNVPVLVLSQLNRESAKESRAPRLSDLRESGDLEQDADVVLLLDRVDDSITDARGADRPAPGTANVIVAKARFGKTGIINLAFDGERGRFSEIARHVDMPFDDTEYEDLGVIGQDDLLDFLGK